MPTTFKAFVRAHAGEWAIRAKRGKLRKRANAKAQEVKAE